MTKISGSNISPIKNGLEFDPYQKEKQLREESASWDTSILENAEEDDIPVINLQPYFSTVKQSALDDAAKQLRIACQEVGFFSIIGHQIPPDEINQMFQMVRRFHELSIEHKRAILMDRPDWPVTGVGYLPINNKKLPTRDQGNHNEAFIIKCDDVLNMEDNQWPDSTALPGFRQTVENYACSLEQLSKRLLPVFATALDMPACFFNKAFESPLYRLRMTHYPPITPSESDHFGIAPHVDTTFCTILAQDQPGLAIFSERKKKWIKAPLLKNAFIVNSGELLKQWTNDRFISVKHFANNNTGSQSRYSIPFFLNANPNHVMSCIPSCCGPDNPPRYPPISYAMSQAIAQGE